MLMNYIASLLLLCVSLTAQIAPGVIVTNLGGGCSATPMSVPQVGYHTTSFGWCPAPGPHYSTWFTSPFCGIICTTAPPSTWLLMGLGDPNMYGPPSMLPAGCILHTSHEFIAYGLHTTHWACVPAGYGGTVFYQRLDWGNGIQNFELSNGFSIYYP